MGQEGIKVVIFFLFCLGAGFGFFVASLFF
jgi:hypothetical protein